MSLTALQRANPEGQLCPLWYVSVTCSLWIHRAWFCEPYGVALLQPFGLWPPGHIISWCKSGGSVAAEGAVATYEVVLHLLMAGSPFGCHLQEHLIHKASAKGKCLWERTRSYVQMFNNWSNTNHELDTQMV